MARYFPWVVLLVALGFVSPVQASGPVAWYESFTGGLDCGVYPSTGWWAIENQNGRRYPATNGEYSLDFAADTLHASDPTGVSQYVAGVNMSCDFGLRSA